MDAESGRSHLLGHLGIWNPQSCLFNLQAHLLMRKTNKLGGSGNIENGFSSPLIDALFFFHIPPSMIFTGWFASSAFCFTSFVESWAFKLSTAFMENSSEKRWNWGIQKDTFLSAEWDHSRLYRWDEMWNSVTHTHRWREGCFPAALCFIAEF